MESVKKLKYLSILTFIAIGRYTLSRLLSSDKPVPEPRRLNSKERYLLKCPSRNILSVEFDGLQDAQALVFIHGLNSSSDQWYYQRRFFEDKYRLIFIDLPGHGRSAMPKNLSIAVIAEDLDYILDYSV